MSEPGVSAIIRKSLRGLNNETRSLHGQPTLVILRNCLYVHALFSPRVVAVLLKRAQDELLKGRTVEIFAARKNLFLLGQTSVSRWLYASDKCVQDSRDWARKDEHCRNI